ncbi:hypothetical protein AB7X32_19200 [Morganella morganii]|uniref:hypothetical protein n=1 Tax=Morganella morganii TaxID=582 RepID=UPI00277C9EEB|nr:hypothetical protein [Morganella morganii subsp. morganii]
MFPEIVASMSAVRESLNLLKIINEAKNDTELRNATFELQRKLQDIQMDNLKLIDLVYESKARVTELEQEINNKVSFERKVESYSPHTFESGTFSYINNSAIDGSEPPRYLCASCYEQSVVSILQPCKGTSVYLHSFCPHCKNTYRTIKAAKIKFA